MMAVVLQSTFLQNKMSTFDTEVKFTERTIEGETFHEFAARRAKAFGVRWFCQEGKGMFSVYWMFNLTGQICTAFVEKDSLTLIAAAFVAPWF